MHGPWLGPRCRSSRAIRRLKVGASLQQHQQRDRDCKQPLEWERIRVERVPLHLFLGANEREAAREWRGEGI